MEKKEWTRMRFVSMMLAHAGWGPHEGEVGGLCHSLQVEIDCMEFASLCLKSQN